MYRDIILNREPKHKHKEKWQELFFQHNLYWLIIFFVAPSTLWGQSRNIEITDCQTGEAVSDVYVVNGSGHFLAESNVSGHCDFIPDKWPLFMKRQGYRTLIIYEPTDLKQHICLVPVKYELPAVTVHAKKENLQKYLLKLRKKNLPWFIAHDTTTYYRFNYTLQFPEKNWQENATGVIAFHWQRHKSIWTEVGYLQYHYSCSDTGFWSSRYYRAVHPGGVYHVLRYNLMGNDDGYRLWKRLVNKEKTLQIPIPKFMLSKEQRELLRKINENPIKYHMSQYGSEKRNLTLRLDSVNNRIFTTHYSDYDTSGYIAEKIVFDGLDRLKKVYYYTPENLSTNYFTLDSATLSTVSRQSKINNDSSYYYSSYTYGVEHQPILLKDARHLEMFYVDEQHYRVSVHLSLIDTIPRKDFVVKAYYWKGSTTNGELVGLEKGQKVLNAIDANLKSQSN